VLRVASAADVPSDASTPIAPSAVLSGDCKLPAAAMVVLPFNIVARRVPGTPDHEDDERGLKAPAPGQEEVSPVGWPLAARAESSRLTVCAAALLCCRLFRRR
jgi:hypothetical protein